jgi:hypothetical protein
MSLEEVKHQIAMQISALPPAIQAEVLRIVAASYTAGYQDCRKHIKEASKSLTVH